MLRAESLRNRERFQFANVKQHNVKFRLSRRRQSGAARDDGDDGHSRVLAQT